MAKEQNNSSFVAAIVLGSSKLTGIVGRKEPSGTVNVLAYTAVASSDFMTKGRVYNVEKMTVALKNIKETLEEKTGRHISSMYMGIDCMGIRSIPNTVSRDFPQRETITQEVITSVLTANREEVNEDHLLLEAIPLEYRLGQHVTTEPIGVVTDSFKARFLNIVCNRTAIETLEACFSKANILIARQTISATQLATAVTTEQERNAGCVCVDMGSETTSVAIYKGKTLRHLAVIPLGGANITRDIANVFNCDEVEAESLKRTFGYPDFDQFDENDGETIQLRDGARVRSQRDLAEIIDARVEEIVQNIKHQVEASGFNSETLVNGLFIIGGGAQLVNIGRCFEAHFKGWNLRILKTPQRISVSCSDSLFNEPGLYNVGLAIVDNGDINCNGGEIQAAPTDLFAEEEMPAPDTAAQSAPAPAPETSVVEETPPAPEEKKPKGPGIFKRLVLRVHKILSEET